MGGISPERLVFLDECGVLTNMVRLYGRSPRGTRACALAPFGHWTRVTVLGALGAEGVVGAMTVAGARGGEDAGKLPIQGPVLGRQRRDHQAGDLLGEGKARVQRHLQAPGHRVIADLGRLRRRRPDAPGRSAGPRHGAAGPSRPYVHRPRGGSSRSMRRARVALDGPVQSLTHSEDGPCSRIAKSTWA